MIYEVIQDHFAGETGWCKRQIVDRLQLFSRKLRNDLVCLKLNYANKAQLV
jgi:hypothetical protein